MWRWGGVSNELIYDADSSSIGTAIDEEANHKIIHLERVRKTDGLSHAAFHACPPRSVVAFALLRRLLSNRMLVRVAMTTLGPPPLGVKARDAKRRP